MATPLHVLIIEDQPADVELAVYALQQAGFEPVWQRVERKEEYLIALQEGPDIILADYYLPQFTAMDALHLLQKSGLDIPFIVVTGTLEEMAVECLRQGAADYLLKDRLRRLGPAVVRALSERALRAEKWQAENALKESEARFRRLAENAPDIIYRYVFHPTPLLEYISPAVSAITGYTPEEYYTQPQLFSHLMGVDGEHLSRELVDKEAIGRSMMISLVRKDGDTIWVERRGVFIHDSAGKLVAIEGIVRDVTDQKEAEDAIRTLYQQAQREIAERKRAEEAEREQRALAEALVDLAATLSRTLNLDEVLRRILDNVGHVVPHDGANFMLLEDSVARVIRCQGHYLEQRIEADILALRFPVGSFRNLDQMAQTGQPYLIPDTYADPYWVRTLGTQWIRSYVASPIQLEGEVIGFLNLDSRTPNFFTAVDAERLRAFASHAAIALQNARLYQDLENYSESLEQAVAARTAALQRTTEQVETILNNSPDAILLLGTEGSVDTSNPAFHKMFGYEPGSESWQQLPICLVTPEYALPFAEALHQTMLEGQANRLEIVAQRDDGTTFDADVALAAVKENDTVLSIVCSLRDISALKEVERMKDAFVSNVSHELRTPIASLKLYHDLLLLNPAKQAVYIDRLGREIDRLNFIVEDLLRLSRLDQGRVVLDLAVVDLNVLAQQFVTDRTPLAESRGLTLTFWQQAERPLVWADIGLLAQVLSIILTNAFTYTPPGGAIRLSTLGPLPGDLLCYGLCVQDSGPGIPLEEQPHIFERFYRGKLGRESSAPGTGLGLSIAQEIVEWHEGRIEIISREQPDSGTTFVVWLPTPPPSVA